MKLAPLAIAALLGLSACGDGDVNVTVNQDSTAAAPAPSAPAPSNEPAAPDTASAPGPAPAAPAGAVQAEGFGGVQIGMRAAEAERVLGPVERYGAIEPSESCRYLNPTGAPRGVQFMVYDGTIARYDVSPLDAAAQVPVADLPRTAENIGVGSTEADVRAAYGSRLSTEPHHYVPGGKYLIVAVPDTSRQILFETNEKGIVTELRAGKKPQVGWVEGCS